MIKNIKPSLCCIHNGLKKHGYKFNVMTYSQYVKRGRENALAELSGRSLNNLITIKHILLECVKNNWNYRIGSCVFPLITHPASTYDITSLKDYAEIKKTFTEISNIIKNNNVRCSMHPDQFVVPASERDVTRNTSKRELEQHAFIMDKLDLPKSHEAPINIHMNCYLGGGDDVLKRIAERFINEFYTMSSSVQKRLVLEVEDKQNSWSVKELYDYVYSQTKIPITYDSHHHRCGHINKMSCEDACELARSTWNNIKPLFHFSNGKSSTTDRSHSDYVYEIHPELMNKATDIDFEFKMKESAIIDFYNKKEFFIV
jgi:UV DNA damage endonuclease